MKSILFILFFMTCQNPNFIQGKNYSGYIFGADEFTLVSVENQNHRYTPTIEEIAMVEKLIKDKISCTNKEQINQTDGCPKIHKKLNKYIRQYVGFVNNNQERIIWVNFIWSGKITNEKLSKEIIQVFDGCSYYWNIKVNLDKKDIFDLSINGKG